MKKLLTLTLFVCLLLTGCQNVGKVIASSSTTVDHALKAWSVYVVDGHATDAQSAEVEKYQKSYYVAEDLALDAYRQSVKTGDKEAYKIALDTLKASEQSLIAVIQTFTKKEIK